MMISLSVLFKIPFIYSRSYNGFICHIHYAYIIIAGMIWVLYSYFPRIAADIAPQGKDVSAQIDDGMLHTVIPEY
ncbi:hypothetical protein SDC9_196921 [bioreactor metagenome]|uniref:Uncharacterized protein n=1 Tax=bioreactor metagenome TaxID=1076179 RepID=A0A645ILW4_9ZZZZ